MDKAIRAEVNTIDMTDTGIIIATRFDDWVLFVSDIDGEKFWVDPSVVDIIE